MYIPLTYTVLLCSRLPSSRWYRVVSQLRCFHNDSSGRNYSRTQQHSTKQQHSITHLDTCTQPPTFLPIITFCHLASFMILRVLCRVSVSHWCAPFAVGWRRMNLLELALYGSGGLGAAVCFVALVLDPVPALAFA